MVDGFLGVSEEDEGRQVKSAPDDTEDGRFRRRNTLGRTWWKRIERS